MSNDDRRARPGRTAWLAPVLLGLVAGTALFVAACSGGAHPAGSGPGTGQNLSAQLDAYASCVRHHGVPGFYISRAGSTPPAPGTVQEAFHGWVIPVDPSQSARKACQHLLPRHNLPTGAELHQQFVQALKAARCMRSHGYPNWPDPTVRNGLVANFIPPGIDVNSPHFQATAKACGAGP
jgi:nicotinamidase-related amidase